MLMISILVLVLSLNCLLHSTMVSCQPIIASRGHLRALLGRDVTQQQSSKYLLIATPTPTANFPLLVRTKRKGGRSGGGRSGGAKSGGIGRATGGVRGMRPGRNAAGRKFAIVSHLLVWLVFVLLQIT